MTISFLTAWQQSLDGVRLVERDDGFAVFPASGTGWPDTDEWFCDLGHQRLLSISGPDAKSFLQEYATCDLELMEPGQVRPGACCNRQGRVIADFDVICTAPDALWLRLAAGLHPLLCESLSRYIVFSKAKIDADDTRPLVGLGLCCAPDVAASFELLGAAPEPGQVAVAAGGFWFQEGVTSRYELWLPVDSARAVWEQARSRLSLAGVNAWDMLDIENQRARLAAALSGKFLPQSLGYVTLGAVDFDKGCYLGQEVVARAQYRGEIKRQLLRTTMPAPSEVLGMDEDLVPPPGTRLRAEGIGAGDVIRAVRRQNLLTLLVVGPAALASATEGLRLEWGKRDE